jgi:hypothetical protein
MKKIWASIKLQGWHASIMLLRRISFENIARVALFLWGKMNLLNTRKELIKLRMECRKVEVSRRKIILPIINVLLFPKSNGLSHTQTTQKPSFISPSCQWCFIGTLDSFHSILPYSKIKHLTRLPALSIRYSSSSGALSETGAAFLWTLCGVSRIVRYNSKGV